jgi:hypothetical protein
MSDENTAVLDETKASDNAAMVDVAPEPVESEADPVDNNGDAADDTEQNDDWPGFLEHEKSQADPAAENAPTDADEPTPAAQSSAPAAISPEQATLLKRFHMPTDEFLRLKPETQARLLKHFDERQRWDDSAKAKLDEIEQAKAATKPETPSTPPPPPQMQAKEAWEKLGRDYLGEDMTPILQQAIRAEIDAIGAPSMQEAMRAFGEMLAEFQMEAAISQFKAPQGVDLNDPATRQKVTDRARTLLAASFDPSNPGKYHMKHATADALAMLFAAPLANAHAAAAKSQSQRAIKGSPEPARRSATSRPRLSDEQFDTLAAIGAAKGLEGDRLDRFVRSGGVDL